MIQWRRYLAVLLVGMLVFPWLAPFSASAQDQNVTVKLVKNVGNPTELAVELIGEFQIQETGKTLASSSLRIQSEQNSLVVSQGSDIIYRGSELTIVPHTYGENSIIKVNNQPYLGEIRFVLENGIFVRPINSLPLEDYLKGVVPFEMPASWELEALKAQAIAARTYAARFMNKVIDDSVKYQVYNGYQWSAKSTRAVEETRGQVIQQNGTLIEALYSSSNGGMTEASGSLWQPVAYLTSQEDPYDPQNQWNVSFQKQQIALTGLDLQKPETWWDKVKEQDPSVSQSIKAWLQQNGYENHSIKLAQISDVTIHSERTIGNRIKSGSISLDFMAKHPSNGFVRNPDGTIQIIHREFAQVPATALRTMLGGANVFKSYLVDSVQKEGSSFIITGRGFGHGVGMSQYGANAMAKQAAKATEILAFYYPGTKVTGETGKMERNPSTPIPMTPPVPVNSPLKEPIKEPTLDPVNAPIKEDTKPFLTNMKLSSATFALGSKQPLSIQYQLQKPAVVSIRVYDDKGNIRRIILNESNQSAGNKETRWDGYGLAEGIYTIAVEAKDENGVTSNITSKIQLVGTASWRANGPAKPGVIKSTVMVGLRSQASFQAKPIKLLKNGDQVQVVGKNGAWYRVQIGSIGGFVPDNYIQLKK